MKCEKCKIREATHEHHSVFDKKTGKSDKKSPIQNLCALCHAEIHGISPKVSEIKTLIIHLNRAQKARMAVNNQFRGFTRIEMKVPDYIEEVSKKLELEEKNYAKQIKCLLEGKDHYWNGNHPSPVQLSRRKGKDQDNLGNHCGDVQPFPIYKWLKNVKGISHILAGKLIAYVDINNTPSVASLWAYAGQTPDSRKQKGKKSNWNQDLKSTCYLIADSFVKHRTPKYRDIYDKEKEKQLKLLDDAIFFMKPQDKLQKSKTKKEESQSSHEIQEQIASPPKNKMHCELRARRKAVKEFLKDLWLNWREIEGLIITKEYSEETIDPMKSITGVSPLVIIEENKKRNLTPSLNTI